jgi:hypothetical protein
MSGDRIPSMPAVVHEIAAPATSWDSYFSITALSTYSSLSARRLRAFLTAADHPLPYYRVGGRVLVRRSDFDHWIQIFRQPPDSRDTGAIVRALMGPDETHESPHRHERVRRA